MIRLLLTTLLVALVALPTTPAIDDASRQAYVLGGEWHRMQFFPDDDEYYQRDLTDEQVKCLMTWGTDHNCITPRFDSATAGTHP